jgi:3-oxoacyl-[acyl-carrier protein] reductase
MFDLSGKVALVTGGSRGIGRAAAETLAEWGARVLVGFASQRETAEQVVSGIVARGGTAETLGLDVSDTQATDKSITEAAGRHGRLDILVASAGIAIDGLLLELGDPDFDRMLAVNLKGAVASARAAVRKMMRVRRGRVIFVSSVIGEMGNAGQTAYAATKAALLGVTKSLAREYSPRGITVNAVSPGFIDTDMTAGLDSTGRARIVDAIPLGRAGTAHEVGSAIAFLASDEAGYVTGHALRVNGGLYMA